MSVEITNTNLNIEIVWKDSSGTEFRAKTLPKKSITQIKKDVATDTITIRTTSDSRPYQPAARFIFDTVTVPVTADLDTLYVTLVAYAQSNDALTYDTTFTNADLAGGVLTVTHGLNSTTIGAVTVINPAGVNEAMTFTVVDANSLTLDFCGAIGAGDWTVVVFATA